MRHQKYWHPECRNVPSRPQVRHNICLAQGIEKVRRADNVEEPDQRQRKAPTSSKSDQRQYGKQAADKIAIGSRVGKKARQGLATTPGTKNVNPICRVAWGKISTINAWWIGFSASQGVTYHFAIRAYTIRLRTNCRPKIANVSIGHLQKTISLSFKSHFVGCDRYCQLKQKKNCLKH